jgi:hypothetical protein
MQYMLLIYSDPTYFMKMTPAERDQVLAAFNAYAESLEKAKVLRDANRLAPANTATTVRVRDGKPQVLDGPYADTKEQFGGYFLIDVPNLDVALSWAAKCPGAARGVMEVRPLWTDPA